MGKKKSNKNEGGGGAPEWMATFSDMMTLLMVFFILLFAMSNVDEAKEEKVLKAFNSIFNGGGTSPIGDGSSIGYDLTSHSIIDSGGLTGHQSSEEADLENKINKLIKENNLEDSVQVGTVDRGVEIRLGSSLIFQSGRADIKVEGAELLKRIYEDILKSINNEIVVEGHTDNIPIQTHNFPTNWELSVIRAVNVLRYFVERCGLDSKRISAQGYGEYRNILPNDTPENKALNRRVNIVILRHK